jgi:hypothetical protein
MKRKKPISFEYAEDLTGRRFHFLGNLSHWPRLLGGADAKAHVERRGAKVVAKLAEADFLVVSDERAAGKAKALRDAGKRRAKGHDLRTLDEREFLHLVRPRLEGRSFLFVGGLSRGLDLEGPEAMVAAHGCRLAQPDDASIDFVVVGEGRAAGKTALLRRVEAWQAEGRPLHVLDEDGFLQLVACLRGPQDERFDFRALAVQLRSLTDAKKVERAIQMLKKEALQLYAQPTEESLGGIVRSQRQADAFYACWIQKDGQYSCYDGDLEQCMGLSNDLCKHLVVLLVGLAAQRGFAARTAYEWASAAAKRLPVDEESRSAELILRYKGAQAGEIDWRPTETVPEDYYTL